MDKGFENKFNEKQKEYEKALLEVEHITDGLGKRIDKNIRETVALFFGKWF